MREQIDFMRNTELGFDKEHLLLVSIQDALVEREIPVIRHELEANRNILATTSSYHVPGASVGSQVYVAETDSAMTNSAFNILTVGQDYLKTMGIELLAGRDFHEDISKDTMANHLL